MNVKYLVSTVDNPIYQGNFWLHDRYQTYGQHSFIYDFIVRASRRGFEIDLLVEGLEAFALSAPLELHCNITELTNPVKLGDTNFVLVDAVPDRLLTLLPHQTPMIGIVQNAGTNYSETFLKRCDRFICMTEAAVEYQKKWIEPSKLTLIHQGVDTERFKPRYYKPKSRSLRSRILVYARLDGDKENTILRLVEILASEDVELTVLADGDTFWTLSDRFGAKLVLINFIPCHSIHHFLHNFDVVVSSGRGVMETLASGLPALCAGLGYGGLVLPENIEHLLKNNLTGFGMGCDVSGIMEDVREGMSLDWQTCRRMAEAHCSVDSFIDQVADTFASL